LIEIRNAPVGIQITKSGAHIAVSKALTQSHSEYDLRYVTRFPYLKNSLVTEYGGEVLFVGSGGIFEYTDRTRVSRNIHRELMFILRKQDVCPPPRYGGSTHLVHQVKQVVKEMLSLKEPDLYDLNEWTAYKDDAELKAGSSK
jgi:hypothetical protein